MEIFNNPKTLKKLKGFSDLILEFNIEKYNLFKEMSENMAGIMFTLKTLDMIL